MKRHLVLDASVALAATLGEEPAADLARGALQGLLSLQGIVPGLFPAEIGNALVVRERRGRIHAQQSDAVLADLEKLQLQVDHEGTGATFRDVVKLARTHQLTVYDALYLELALRQHAVLATLDGALAAAARREGVDLAVQPG